MKKRQTNAERQRRYRERKNVTVVTPKAETVTKPPDVFVTPEGAVKVLPAGYGTAICECQQCQTYRRHGKPVANLNHGAYKSLDELGPGEANRVALPGDVDYIPISQTIITGEGQANSLGQTETQPQPTEDTAT